MFSRGFEEKEIFSIPFADMLCNILLALTHTKSILANANNLREIID